MELSQKLTMLGLKGYATTMDNAIVYHVSNCMNRTYKINTYKSYDDKLEMSIIAETPHLKIEIPLCIRNIKELARITTSKNRHEIELLRQVIVDCLTSRIFHILTM